MKKNRLYKALLYAIDGIVYIYKYERNAKMHIVLTIIAVILAILLKFSPIEYVILVIMSTLILTLEMMNTALEKTVDLTTNNQFHQLAKHAKDIAAGAVFISTIAALIIACFLYIPKIIALLT
ncbi:MAG: diacylglycerol kinase [Eubacteriales bacterium]